MIAQHSHHYCQSNKAKSVKLQDGMTATANAWWGLISERSVIVPTDCLANYSTKWQHIVKGVISIMTEEIKSLVSSKIKHQPGGGSFELAPQRNKQTHTRSNFAKRGKGNGPRVWGSHLRYSVHTKAGPFSKAGWLKGATQCRARDYCGGE